MGSRHKLTGICPPSRGLAFAALLRSQPAPVWMAVCDSLREAVALADDALLFLSLSEGKGSPPEVLPFPESIADSPDMREAFTASSDRLAVLARLRGLRGTARAARPLIVATTPAALIQAVPALETFETHALKLERGARQSFQALLDELQRLDYDCEAMCEAPGQYAVRGGIIDVYPVTATEPYRLDFLGDEIEDIRAFDPVTQRSGASHASISVSASPRVKLGESTTGIVDYLGSETRLLLVEPVSLEEQFRSLGSEDDDAGEKLVRACAGTCGLCELEEGGAMLEPADRSEGWDCESLTLHRAALPDDLVATERIDAANEARDAFLEKLGAWAGNGDSLLFVGSREGELQRLREIVQAVPAIRSAKPRFAVGSLNEGFRVRRAEASAGTLAGLAVTSGGLVVVTETEVFGRRRKRPEPQRARAGVSVGQVDQLLDFAELAEGDYVVHLQHGIAHYRGLTRIDTAQGMKEVISLEFDERVTLHVPLQESHLVSRYVGLGKARPQLGRIGTNRWEKTRQAAERATVDLAAELLRIQASREAQAGDPLPVDPPWQKDFEASFLYTETADQARAIRDTKADQERVRPMDRLICGDVGFGKTEVAIRAAFKAAVCGRQVAILVPTTVLAQQHLNTFRERMAGYPVAVELLSRFRTRAEQARILEATADGRIDILIGTHRLLQRDVHFRNLGLVVIDEEQRFGVKHKEEFKRMRATVDVLSMSATPIPRTLYFALTGARDMSVIETPPANRHPIQTVVRTYDERIVVDAIRHELRRGGQIFYLHNRVATIEGVAEHLRQVLPGVSIGVGHGKLDGAGLERVMTDFVAGRYSVLVCTTIIESGLDIPNCNTIIIEGADRFGLAQLYQLRGRVGRFRHQAFAYLLLHRHTRLLDLARRRLGALRTHTQPGAGFRIAMRDLELRGAGNLLGAEQSGHIVGVGFELYCQLLRQSVARLKGEGGAAAQRATVKLDFVRTGEGEARAGSDRGRHEDAYTALRDAEQGAEPGGTIDPIQALLPADYIGETRLRIDLYRRLALALTPADLDVVRADLKDRFGAFGDQVRALLLVTEIRIRAEQKGVVSVESEQSRLKCLRAGSTRNDWIQFGNRFPRLTAPKPLLRLKEIIVFLKNLP